MAIDYTEYLRASNGDGEAVRAVVVTEREVGHTLINVDKVTNWPHKFIATSGVVDFSTGLMDPDTICVFYGSLEGTMIHIDEYASGYYDRGHEPDEMIVLKPTTPWADALVEAAAEPGVPPGGTEGQALIKKSDADGDVEWGSVTPTESLIFLASHPVGSTYWNETDSRNPGTVWGGTWVALEGVVLGGRSTASGSPFNVAAGTIIGEDEHTLTVSELAAHSHSNGTLTAASSGSHTHNTNGFATEGGSGSANWGNVQTNGGLSKNRANRTVNSGGAHTHNVTGNTSSAGGGDPHNNIQRTKVGYLWKRTA